MNGPDRLLLDTNAVIDLLRGDSRLNALAAGADWIGISIITHLEFLAFPGIASQDVTLFEAFLQRVEVADLCHSDRHLLQTIVRLRQAYALKLPDAVIAATALLRSATLMTADRKLLQLSRKVPGLVCQ